ncbi:MAG TPA: hypothetical protein VF171_06260, partial [Trueperaceae bacterium]
MQRLADARHNEKAPETPLRCAPQSAAFLRSGTPPTPTPKVHDFGRKPHEYSLEHQSIPAPTHAP